MTIQQAITHLEFLKVAGLLDAKPNQIDNDALDMAIKALKERPTGQVNCSHCDYLNFSKKIIEIIVEVMTKYGIESVEDLQRELDRYKKGAE